MGFKQHMNVDYLTYHDLPAGGACGTITQAYKELRENFRTKVKEDRVILNFTEWKEMTLTNKNLGLLDDCFPELTIDTLPGTRIWLMPVDIEVGGEAKQIVRIDMPGTMRLQPDPSLTAAAPAALAEPAHMQDQPPDDLDAAFMGDENPI